jgi:hypothetical protein
MPTVAATWRTAPSHLTPTSSFRTTPPLFCAELTSPCLFTDGSPKPVPRHHHPELSHPSAGFQNRVTGFITRCHHTIRRQPNRSPLSSSTAALLDLAGSQTKGLFQSPLSTAVRADHRPRHHLLGHRQVLLRGQPSSTTPTVGALLPHFTGEDHLSNSVPTPEPSSTTRAKLLHTAYAVILSFFRLVSTISIF